ncbi:MAG: helicase-related protein, partial [Ktedonobacteraceae bacterium]
NYNSVVMRVKRRFVEEIKHRQAEREHTLSLNQSQRYILRELRELFKLAAEEDEKAQINILEKAFRGPITTAINRELNLLRRNTIHGKDLLKSLGQMYFQHNMREWVERRNRQTADDEVPRIICSEGLL